MPASRSARAITLAPRSCPSRPGLAIRTRIGLSIVVLCSTSLSTDQNHGISDPKARAGSRACNSSPRWPWIRSSPSSRSTSPVASAPNIRRQPLLPPTISSSASPIRSDCPIHLSSSKALPVRDLDEEIRAQTRRLQCRPVRALREAESRTRDQTERRSLFAGLAASLRGRDGARCPTATPRP